MLGKCTLSSIFPLFKKKRPTDVKHVVWLGEVSGDFIVKAKNAMTGSDTVTVVII